MICGSAVAPAGVAAIAATPAGATALPQIKSYRENDGKFYFKLATADGAVLLQSRAFDSPKDAGRLVAALVDAGDDRAAQAGLLLDAAPAAEIALPADAIAGALAALKADKLAKA